MLRCKLGFKIVHDCFELCLSLWFVFNIDLLSSYLSHTFARLFIHSLRHSNAPSLILSHKSLLIHPSTPNCCFVSHCYRSILIPLLPLWFVNKNVQNKKWFICITDNLMRNHCHCIFSLEIPLVSKFNVFFKILTKYVT